LLIGILLNRITWEIKQIIAELEAFKISVNKVIICSGLTETPILDALEKNAGTVIINE